MVGPPSDIISDGGFFLWKDKGLFGLFDDVKLMVAYPLVFHAFTDKKDPYLIFTVQAEVSEPEGVPAGIGVVG